jgi:peptidoglycan/xylan/chitin deacetylase (PgdA/CDA1 family)
LTFSEELGYGAAGIALATAVAGTLTYAALSAGSQIFGPTLIAGDDPNEVALTYDDGPNDNATDALLDLLARYKTRASFFMIGEFVRQRPEIVRRVHAAGHLVGNHTQTHPWLHLKPEHVIREELRGCSEAIEDAIGAPVRYFRAPHGARRPAVLRIARELGMKIVQWNAMGHDWQPIGLEAMLASIERGRERARRRGRGTNVLLHDGHDVRMGSDRAVTLQLSTRLLERLAREGVRTVTVDAWG